jgi:hypothetical protein
MRNQTFPIGDASPIHSEYGHSNAISSSYSPCIDPPSNGAYGPAALLSSRDLETVENMSRILEGASHPFFSRKKMYKRVCCRCESPSWKSHPSRLLPANECVRKAFVPVFSIPFQRPRIHLTGRDDFKLSVEAFTSRNTVGGAACKQETRRLNHSCAAM